MPSGFRDFVLGENRFSRGSSRLEPGFMRIEDREQDSIEYYPYGNGRTEDLAGKGGDEDDEKGDRKIEFLPKVMSTRIASTLCHSHC